MTKIAELISVYGAESDAASFFDTESDIFNILDYAAGATIYDGVTSAYTALNDAVSAANTSGGIVYIPTTANGSTYLIDSSITIPSNVKLKIQNGAILKLSSGSDMTINGDLLDGSVSVTLSASNTTGGTMDLDKAIEISNTDDSVKIDTNGIIVTTGKLTYTNEQSISIINSYGVNPSVFDYFKNMVYNSSFEVFDEGTLLPTYWTGTGVSDPNSNFYGDYSCKLTASAYIETDSTAYINPAFFDNDLGIVSFNRKLGQCKLEVYDVTNAAYFTLTDLEGNTGASKTFDATSNWQNSQAVARFDPTEHGSCTQLKIKITNVHATETGYVDAVMLHPSYTKLYPQAYKDGPKSNGVAGTLQGIVVSTTEPTDTTLLWLDTN